MIPNFKKIRFINDITDVISIPIYIATLLIIIFSEAYQVAAFIMMFNYLLMLGLKTYLLERLRWIQRHELYNDWRDKK